MKRIKLFHLYGPEVFEEACLDPIKTMRKDILPRFCRSPIYESMIHRLASCDPPPATSYLHVPTPVGWIDSFLSSSSLPIHSATIPPFSPIFMENRGIAMSTHISTNNLLPYCHQPSNINHSPIYLSPSFFIHTSFIRTG